MTTSTSEVKEGSITVDTKQQVLTATDTLHYMVRRSDWQRLRRSLQRCSMAGTSLWEGAGWAMSGVCCSAAFGLIGLTTADEAKVPLWIKPTCWSIAIGAAAISAAFLLLTRDKRIQNARAIAVIYDDVTEIENAFYPTDNKPHQ